MDDAGLGERLSAFAKLDEIARQRIWDGVAGRVVQGERITLAIVELDPGRVVPEHSHENEQVGVCVAGALSFRIGEETRELRPGGTWRILGGTPHEVCTGREGAVVIEAFSPVRADWEELERLEPARPRWPQ